MIITPLQARTHVCGEPDAVFNAVINTAPASPQELGAVLITRVSTNRSVRLERGDCSAVLQSSHSSPSPGGAGYARPTKGPQHYSITASRQDCDIEAFSHNGSSSTLGRQLSA